MPRLLVLCLTTAKLAIGQPVGSCDTFTSLQALRAGEAYTKLFIGGLASTTDEESLKEFYEQWGGKITDVVVMRDGVTKRSRGFGFVTFTTEDELDVAMTHRPHVINSKEVDAKRAVPKEFQNKAEAQVSSKRVYVNGIKPEHNEENLRAYFQELGNVTGVEIVVDKKTDERRGFAFVTFDDYDPADKVVLTKYHTIEGKRCDCRKALSKDEMAKVQQMDMDRQFRGQRSRGPNPGYGGYPPDVSGRYADGFGRGMQRQSWNPRPQAPGANFPPNQANYGVYPSSGSRWGAQQPVAYAAAGQWQQTPYGTGPQQTWSTTGAAYGYSTPQQPSGASALYSTNTNAGGYAADGAYGMRPRASGPSPAPQAYDPNAWSQNRAY